MMIPSDTPHSSTTPRCCCTVLSSFIVCFDLVAAHDSVQKSLLLSPPSPITLHACVALFSLNWWHKCALSARDNEATSTCCMFHIRVQVPQSSTPFDQSTADQRQTSVYIQNRGHVKYCTSANNTPQTNPALAHAHAEQEHYQTSTQTLNSKETLHL
jgi:hypothetical protein